MQYYRWHWIGIENMSPRIPSALQCHSWNLHALHWKEFHLLDPRSLRNLWRNSTKIWSPVELQRTMILPSTKGGVFSRCLLFLSLFMCEFLSAHPLLSCLCRIHLTVWNLLITNLYFMSSFYSSITPFQPLPGRHKCNCQTIPLSAHLLPPKNEKQGKDMTHKAT